jgi:predicted nucleotidyltransferase
MKNSLQHLPEKKQAELVCLVEIIKSSFTIEWIILFGSFARGDWVEEIHPDGYRYQYQSDFDILVIVETRSESKQSKIQQQLEDKFEQERLIKTPITVLVHDIEFVNRRLSKAQYFFSDIKKEGVCLYDSGRFPLNEPKVLSGKERQQLAKEDFTYWFNSAVKFFETFEFNFKRKELTLAAFELHQVVERLYSTILLVFTRYKPNTHDLRILRKHVNTLHSNFSTIFYLKSKEDKNYSSY